MYVSIGEAAEVIGVAISTLRRWEKEKRFSSTFRTKGGHRRYNLSDIQKEFFNSNDPPEAKKVIAYARVSSHGQKEDLERQMDRLKNHCKRQYKDFEIISDLGSGINYKKKGLQKLIKLICSGKLSVLVLTHRDRLLRFGSPLLFKLCEFYGTKIEILEKIEEMNFEKELVADVIEIMTVFTAKMYGKRSHQNKKAA